MFSPHLFNHIYDIDTVISALVSNQKQYLETQGGTLSPTPPEGVPSTHFFAIEPLPPSYLNELATHPEIAVLTPEEQQQIQSITSTSPLSSLPTFFEKSRPGAWLRERLKDTALEWLDQNNLIPPSMRHINRKKAIQQQRSILITEAE